ncbi:MAG: SprT-like domain-containing protein [bacterium]
MLRALTRFFRRPRDTAQLELGFTPDAPRTAEELLSRLRQLGLKRIDRCRLTHNRNVMVSFGGGELRVHEGYLLAPEVVLRAIVAFVEGRTKADRRAAQRVIVEHPIVSTKPRGRRELTHDDDVEIAEQLQGWHARYNTRHFDGRLKAVAIRVSRRMKSRLGHYTAGSGGDDAEIAISRAHVKKHGWPEALHTLLHEMVHQWQDESRLIIDHGSNFRAKARAVGIEPYARRVLAARPGRGEGAVTLGRRAARQG